MDSLKNFVPTKGTQLAKIGGMISTTSVSQQHRELEGITSHAMNEGYRDKSTKWASAPSDCLSLIFGAGLEYTLTGREFYEATVTGNDRELCRYLLTITRICRWWRQVALDTPRLWRFLILNERVPLSKLQTWLDRSKAAPLYINLMQGLELSLSTYSDTELVPPLLQHINHWGRFIYTSDYTQGLANILEALEGKEAPLLEKLSLSGIGGLEPQRVSKLFNGPQSVPKLVDVELRHIPLDWSISPFRNLRALLVSEHYAGAAGLEQFMAILQESPQLMKLEFVGRPVRSDELTAAFMGRSNQTPQPVSLPSLTFLSISYHPGPNILTLTLKLIHAPNLEKLQLSVLERNEEGSHDVDFSSTIEALGHGVLSSFERLETLSLYRVSFRSKAAWYSFCSRLTHLRDMSLIDMLDGPTDPEHHDGVYGCLLSALLPRKDILDLTPDSDATTGIREIRCPNLQKLDVHHGGNKELLENLKRRRSEIGYGIAQVIYEGDE